MLDGKRIVQELAAERAAGASLDDLLNRAVEAIEAAEERFHWVGVYLLEASEASPDDPGELVLHNYIGRPTDHARIEVGVGVCGTAVAEGRDINVPDVRAIDNYLACSVQTRSELVVLIRDDETDRIHGQLDLDSDEPAAFTERDAGELRVVAVWLAGLFD